MFSCGLVCWGRVGLITQWTNINQGRAGGDLWNVPASDTILTCLDPSCEGSKSIGLGMSVRTRRRGKESKGMARKRMRMRTRARDNNWILETWYIWRHIHIFGTLNLDDQSDQLIRRWDSPAVFCPTGHANPGSWLMINAREGRNHN